MQPSKSLQNHSIPIKADDIWRNMSVSITFFSSEKIIYMAFIISSPWVAMEVLDFLSA